MRVLLFFALLILSGCSPRVIRTHTSERVVDTLVRTEIDSAMVRALLDCDSMGRVRLLSVEARNSALISQNINLKDSLLYIDTKSVSVLRDRERVVRDTVYVAVPAAKSAPEVRDVYKMRWWQRWVFWVGVFYLVRIPVKYLIQGRTLGVKSILKLL